MDEEEIFRAVQRMQDYIEGHLNQRITLKDLANEAGYSPWYAARRFKEITGKAPFDYIRARRLTVAALRLRDQEVKIIDVALDFVFDSHEGFTRAFSREFGMSPSLYGKKTPPIALFMPQKVFDTYQFMNKGGNQMNEAQKTKTVFVQMIERPARKLLIKRGIKAEDYFDYCEEVGCEIWSVLCSVKEALYEPIGMWLPKHLIPDGTSRYVQGVELPLDYSNQIPDGYELIQLPPCTMMVFQGEPYDDNHFEEAIKEMWAHVKSYDPTLYGYEWDQESAPRFQLVPMGYRGYIEAWPVKAVNKNN
ncbi:AraC family transcriptional regulator [Eubacteriaceae bacterium ES3]|nr:AraC family transcriptional regulator [Eubacteriaceae bacterium ES3]